MERVIFAAVDLDQCRHGKPGIDSRIRRVADTQDSVVRRIGVVGLKVHHHDHAQLGVAADGVASRAELDARIGDLARELTDPNVLPFAWTDAHDERASTH
jgi:hypothetical protein